MHLSPSASVFAGSRGRIPRPAGPAPLHCPGPGSPQGPPASGLAVPSLPTCPATASLCSLIVCRRTTLLSSTPAETPRAMRHRVSQKGGRAFAPSSWEVTTGPLERLAGHWSRFLAGPFPPAPGQGLDAQMSGSDAHGGAESRSPARPAPRACRGVTGRAEGTKPHRRAPLLTGILGCGVNREV